jgi:hypothetical protein
MNFSTKSVKLPAMGRGDSRMGYGKRWCLMVFHGVSIYFLTIQESKSPKFFLQISPEAKAGAFEWIRTWDPSHDAAVLPIARVISIPTHDIDI